MSANEKKAAEDLVRQTDSTQDDAAEANLGDLNVDDMDLTVETVEERISPSETNVFDK